MLKAVHSNPVSRFCADLSLQADPEVLAAADVARKLFTEQTSQGVSSKPSRTEVSVQTEPEASVAP